VLLNNSNTGIKECELNVTCYSKKVNVTTFVTNMQLWRNISGYIGFAPCYEAQKKFSFSSNMLKDKIRSIEYITPHTNDRSPNNFNAFMVLNQAYSLDSFDRLVPVVSMNQNFSDLLYNSTGTTHHDESPKNNTEVRMRMYLGRLISSG
jgi:hypothetical protein